MTRLFDVDGDNLDRGFVNLKVAASRIEQELNELIESMAARFSNLAARCYP